jgi:hypothetical protein
VPEERRRGQAEAVMITRLVGLPWGTAIEAALATTTEPRNSGANGAPKRRARMTSGGIMSTTAPSSDTAAVASAHTPHTSA